MSSCEKCWSDSASFAGDHSADYRALVKSRDASGHACTPEEQAGPDATHCPRCHRRACHQHVGNCMACGWDPMRELVRDPEAAVKELGPTD